MNLLNLFSIFQFSVNNSSGVLKDWAVWCFCRHIAVLVDLQRCLFPPGVTVRSVDYLVFSVDKDIMLHGLSLFGSENNANTVDFQVKDASNSSAVASKKGAFLSKRLQYKDSYYYGYEVLFDSAAELKKNIKYQIEALISGASSGREMTALTLQCSLM